ncbi:MAG TPA: primase-helicase family protein [Geminicoccus sp.]|jgi:hypothetical protein|uniref:primase-helicase family protein n=1 Tax=Geminicoccus sp. TaxID=2024832 RepID=UPI002E306588|nr:primase-helicase family protein [Geminicoccus sp.]HEX2527440.1 primase-helicase family protein [Geminicoccus sp.]
MDAERAVIEPDELDDRAEEFLDSLRAAGMPDEAWKTIRDEAIDELNERYFVASLGGRSVIASVIHDDALDRDRLVYSRPADIKLQYNHRHIKVGVNVKGYDIIRDLGTAWIEAPRRRTYRQIALVPKGACPPDVFNLWRGWGLEPASGEWPTIKDHLLTVICSGNETYLEWLIGWMAYCVQYPERQAEVAVVLRGKKGTGKGMVGQLLMRIFRHHAIHISNSKHLIGHFNSHLADGLFLFLDEALWAGDKAGEGILKALITEKTLMIEPKGLDAFPMPNRLKILVSSNNDWVVPATSDERRFFMLDVSDCKRGDKEYFETLAAAIEGGESQAFLDHLLTYDLSGWQHRSAPHTEALNEQKLTGADSVTRYWYDCLSIGELIGCSLSESWPPDIPVQVLHAAYLDHARDHGDWHPATVEQMAKRLRKLMPDENLITIRPRKAWGDLERPTRYQLKGLSEHRSAFEEAMNLPGHAWRDAE